MFTKLSNKLKQIVIDLKTMLQIMASDNDEDREKFCKNLPKRRKLLEFFIYAYLVTLLIGLVYFIYLGAYTTNFYLHTLWKLL